MSSTMRSPRLIEQATVCQNAHAFQNPAVRTEADASVLGIQNCPAMGPCGAGTFEARDLTCVAGLGGQMARFVAKGGTIEGELRDISNAPIFPPTRAGFFDPYKDPNEIVTDKDTAIEMVRGWAELVLYGPEYERPVTIRSKAVSDPAIAELVKQDQFETVFPDGVPTKVPKGTCRCPILRVGDFCPVHGG